MIKDITDYKDITEDIEIRFDTSNYELDRLLAKEKNKERWISWKVMIEFVGLRTKKYSYLTDDGCEVKKAKCTKSVS